MKDGQGVDDGDLTLREAIAYVSGTYLPDESDPDGDFGRQIDDKGGTEPRGVNDLIKFDPSVFGAPTTDFSNRVDTIALLHGQLVVNNPVTIDGAAGTILPGDTEETPGPGWENLTIDATGSLQGPLAGSRIFKISVAPATEKTSRVTTIRELSLA